MSLCPHYLTFGSNPGPHGGKLATNRVSYDMVLHGQRVLSLLFACKAYSLTLRIEVVHSAASARLHGKASQKTVLFIYLQLLFKTFFCYINT